MAELTGPVRQGEVWPGFCCRGFDFEIFMAKNIATVSAWGVCNNPLHQKQSDVGDTYTGIKFVSEDDRPEGARMGSNG